MSASRWPVLLVLSLLPAGGCLTADKTTAEATGSNAVELPPREGARACLAVATAFERESKEKEAAIQYERARALDPGLKVSRQLAVLYDKIGEPQRAQREFETALVQSPKDAELLNSFGYFCYNCGKLDVAEARLREALAINPKYQRAWNNLALVLGQQQRYDECLEAFRKVVSEADAHSNLAFLLTTQGKVAQAKEAYRHALQLEPNLLRARLALEKLEHPGSKAPPASTTEDARRKEMRERLLARTRTTTTTPVAAAEPPPLPTIVVAPPTVKPAEEK